MHITELQFCRPIDLCMHSVVATHKEYTTYGLGTSMYGEFWFGKKKSKLCKFKPTISQKYIFLQSWIVFLSEIKS